MLKRVFSFLFAVWLFSCHTAAAEFTLSAKSAILTDASTGQILYADNADIPLPPASITKIMTLLLIMQHLDQGLLHYDDMVTASEHAKSMGGSTIYLDTGESMSVRDLIKGIAVASANDACVAMAEHIAGSEDAFVSRMNEEALRLGMEHTHFVNTNGLPAEGHVSSALDVAIMARELMRYPDIFTFTTIWTDSLRGGSFSLANTNRLIRFYDGATGLKTGSTAEAGCCICATAERDGLPLIAVIMGAPTSNDRFSDARTLLDFGFANYALWQSDDPHVNIRITKGEQEFVGTVMAQPLLTLLTKSDKAKAVLVTEMPESLPAPILAGQVVGRAVCRCDDIEVASCDLLASEDVKKLGLGRAFTAMLRLLFQR